MSYANPFVILWRLPFWVVMRALAILLFIVVLLGWGPRAADRVWNSL